MVENNAHNQIDESNGIQEELVEETALLVCQEKLSQAEARFAYLSADFDNFRRNTSKERAVWGRTAQAQIFEDLVTIVDDFDRAFNDLAHATDLQEAEVARFKGFDLIHKALIKLLAQHEVVAIEATGVFNPQHHEALVQIDAPDTASGQIVDVLQKGYMFKDMVLRPAKVSVAK
jgi:molecular chaperone GrpE